LKNQEIRRVPEVALNSAQTKSSRERRVRFTVLFGQTRKTVAGAAL
jgi:hypothetical protein